MAMWNPWRGCRKCSEGCLYCYIHKGDAKHRIDTSEIVKTNDFTKPVEKKKNADFLITTGCWMFESNVFEKRSISNSANVVHTLSKTERATQFKQRI